MTEEEMLENAIDDDFKAVLNPVLEKLKKYFKKSFTTFSQINPEEASNFLESLDIPVQNDCKSALTTPYAIARYVLLKEDEEANVNKVDKDLKSFLDMEKVSWIISRNLKNEVIFTNTMSIVDEKPQSLIVTYFFDTDLHIHYTIYSRGIVMGWEVSRSVLKALLENSTPQTIVEKENCQCIAENSTEQVKIVMGNTEIFITKK